MSLCSCGNCQGADPTKGPYIYDGYNYIWGPNHEMIAETRGAGGQLPICLNGRLLAASWKMNALLKKLTTVERNGEVFCASCGVLDGEAHTTKCEIMDLAAEVVGMK